MQSRRSQNNAVGRSRQPKCPTHFLAALAIGLMLCGGLANMSATARAAQTAKPEDIKKMESALPEKAPADAKQKRKVLVYGNANGFVHSSIPLGEQTIVELGEKTGAYTATINNEPAAFDTDNLKDFDAVVLVSTTGHFLLPRTDTKGKSDEEKKAIDEKVQSDVHAEKQRMQNLVDFVEKDGKGLMGIHAATDAYYDVREYGELMGGYFNGHPWNEKIGIKVDDPASPLTKMFEKDGIDVADEIYQFTPKGIDKEGHPNQTYSREAARPVEPRLHHAGPNGAKGKNAGQRFRSGVDSRRRKRPGLLLLARASRGNLLEPDSSEVLSVRPPVRPGRPFSRRQPLGQDRGGGRRKVAFSPRRGGLPEADQISGRIANQRDAKIPLCIRCFHDLSALSANEGDYIVNPIHVNEREQAGLSRYFAAQNPTANQITGLIREFWLAVVAPDEPSENRCIKFCRHAEVDGGYFEVGQSAMPREACVNSLRLAENF